MKRLNRIFKSDGKTVIIAMDHGMGMNVNPALDKTGEIVSAIAAGGADAILTTYGIVTTYGHLMGDMGVIMRADGGYSALPSQAGGHPRLMYGIEDALRAGADAVVCNGFPGTPDEQECMRNVARLCADGHAWGVPVIVEALPGGFGNEVPNTPENVRLATRTGCEYGASVIKTAYAGTPEEFRTVVEASYKPVVVLGGEAAKDLSGLFELIENAMAVGAKGVAIGRNVWNHKDPAAVTKALVDLVHGGAKASDFKGL